MTPFQEAGYKPTDKFRVTRGVPGSDGDGAIVQLYLDDGSECPLFKILDGSSVYHLCDGMRGRYFSIHSLEKIQDRLESMTPDTEITITAKAGEWAEVFLVIGDCDGPSYHIYRQLYNALVKNDNKTSMRKVFSDFEEEVHIPSYCHFQDAWEEALFCHKKENPKFEELKALEEKAAELRKELGLQ